jgi:hypothetical protein
LSVFTSGRADLIEDGFGWLQIKYSIRQLSKILFFPGAPMPTKVELIVNVSTFAGQGACFGNVFFPSIVASFCYRALPLQAAGALY